MVMVELSERTVARLARIAQERKQSLDEALTSLLNSLPAPEAPAAESPEEPYDENNPRPGTMGALIKAAKAANIRGGPDDVAERSREILNKEFPEYLLRRMQESMQEEEARKKRSLPDQE